LSSFNIKDSATVRVVGKTADDSWRLLVRVDLLAGEDWGPDKLFNACFIYNQFLAGVAAELT
jgi:hypothetical protein